MTCPKCNTANRVEIMMHSDGYAKDLLECTCCGTIWRDGSNEIISESKKAA